MRDPIRWMNDDYGLLYKLCQEELFDIVDSPFTLVPKRDMVLVARHLLRTSPSFFNEDPMNLAVVLGRMAAQRVFTARAIQLEAEDIA